MQTNQLSTKLEADVVVIGSGAAGLPAAITSVENGAEKVIILEQRKVIGGNSLLATGLFACESTPQRINLIDFPDKDETFKKVMLWHRGEMIDPLVLRAYINKSADTIDWLMDKGVEFEIGSMGPSLPRCFHVVKSTKRGCRYSDAVAVLKQVCQDKNIPILRNAKCEKIIRNTKGEISGVVFSSGEQKTEIAAKAVIIATGGFTGNKTLLKKYFPFYDENTYQGHMVLLEGDGIKLAQEVGAALYDSACMIRESCRTFTKSKYHMSLFHSMGQPDIMIVNKKGERIVDEAFGGGHPSMFSNILLNQPDQMAFAIYDQNRMDDLAKRTGPLPRPLAELLKELSKDGSGAKVSESLEEIAGWIGADIEVLRKSIERYNEFCANSYYEDFAKEPRFLSTIAKPPYYGIKFTVLMIDTIGPIKVNHKMEVKDAAATPIPGLYAAGVIAGGWCSHDYCQDFMFGSGVGWSANSGRIAGENAAKYLRRAGK
jgi:fumarate reductase flavoprotein subunit